MRIAKCILVRQLVTVVSVYQIYRGINGSTKALSPVTFVFKKHLTCFLLLQLSIKIITKTKIFIVMVGSVKMYSKNPRLKEFNLNAGGGMGWKFKDREVHTEGKVLVGPGA